MFPTILYYIVDIEKQWRTQKFVKGGFGAENTIALIRGSQTGVHLGFSKGTLSERISLFKLNSVSKRNNGLKCLEFSNPVDYNYVKQDN